MGKEFGKPAAERAVDEIKAGGRDGGAASDEVVSTLAHSSPGFRNEVFNASKNDPALIEELGLMNATDIFLSGDKTRDSGTPVPADVDIQFRNDGKQDVMVVTEGNTRSYLGKNGDYQTFEYVPGQDDQPGTVEVNNNGDRTSIPGVTGYNADGPGGAPEITTATGQSSVQADGSVKTKMNNGIEMVTDGSGDDGISGRVTSYKNPAAGLDVQVKTEDLTADGKFNLEVEPDGTFSYKTIDGWNTTVSPDGKEVRTRGEGFSEITEWRDKPGGDVVKAQYGPRGANDRPFSAEEIEPSGIDQTGLGDCWFMSSVAGMAESPQGKETLSNMIKRNGDGSYTVTFPGDSSNPVTVTGQDVLGNDKINDDALWAKVMEAAILKHSPDEAQHGGRAYDAIDLLTNKYVVHETIFNDILTDSEHLGDVINSALEKGEPVVVSSRTGRPEDGPVENPHAYTVSGFDPATNTVTVRNPWGHNDLGSGETKDSVTDIGDGYMKMSLETFTQNFDYISYGGQPKSFFQQKGERLASLGHDLVEFGDWVNPFN